MSPFYRQFHLYKGLKKVVSNCKSAGNWRKKVTRSQFVLLQNALVKVTHKGLKLPKRFTNLPSNSSGCPGEKRRSCIRRKNWDWIKMLYFLFLLFPTFSPWDSQFKLMSKNGKIMPPHHINLNTFINPL